MLNYLNVERGHDNELEIFKKDYEVMEQVAKEAKKTMLEIEAMAIERGLAKRKPYGIASNKMPSYTLFMKAFGEDAEDAFTEIRNILYTFFLEKDKYKTSAGILRKRTQKQAQETVLQETVRNAPTKLNWIGS
jgi:predicted Zn-dependent protease